MKTLTLQEICLISGGNNETASSSCMIVKGYNYLTPNGVEFVAYSIETGEGVVTFGKVPGLPLESNKMITCIKCSNPDFTTKL